MGGMDIDSTIARLAATQDGLFSQRQVVAAGGDYELIRNRRRSGRWLRVVRGVYRFPGSALDARQLARAAVLAGPDGAVASHRTAAALWEIPGFRPGPVECLVPAPRSHRSRLSRAHNTNALPAHHVVTLGTIAVTTPARTLFDLAGRLHPVRVGRAVDNALSMRLTSAPQLHRMLDELAASGRNGISTMRALLAERPPHLPAPESATEARFLVLLSRAGLPAPRRQVDLGGDEWVGRVDFYYPDHGLVIEIDSDRFHGALLDARNDARRDAAFAALDLRTLRVTDHEVWHEPERCVRRVERALDQPCPAGWSGKSGDGSRPAWRRVACSAIDASL